MINISSLLVWFVIGTWGILLFTVLRDRTEQSRGWLPVAIGSMALTLVLFFIQPDYAGYVGLATTIIFGYAPAQGFRRMGMLASRGHYKQAKKVSRWVRILHPAGNWHERLTWYDIYQHTQQNNLPAIKQHLTPLIQAGNPRAIIYNYTIQDQWHELAHWFETALPADKLAQDTQLSTQYLRALGESNQQTKLLQAYQQYKPHLIQTPSQLHLAKMLLFAFCGRKQALSNLLETHFTFLPPYIRQLWLATAELANGNNASAQTLLDPLTALNDAQFQRTVQRRLARIPAEPANFSPAEQDQLTTLEQTQPDEAALPASYQSRSRWAHATYALIGLNVLMFITELALGGSQNPFVLLRLGALYPPAVLAGEWWRVVASTFLHADWMHLLLNMFALLGLGPFLEHHWGKLRYTILYLVAGVGASTLTVGLTVVGFLDPDIFYVGASGSIMGLIGATGAVYWKLWRRQKLAYASNRLAIIVFIVVLQTIFDLTTPEISFIGHALGLLIGLLLGLRFSAPDQR